MSAVNVGNPLAINLSYLNTREFTLEKGLLNVMNVENLLPLVLPSVIIREFTQEKSLTCAKCVIRASIFTYIREITPKRSHINMTVVVRA